MNQKRLNIGIFGYGYMGKIRESVVRQHPQLNLIGICEPDPSVQKKIQRTKVFNSPLGLLQENIDAMIVCTPNSVSPEIVIEGLKRGKHVFCEKPPGRSLQDVQRIREHETSQSKLMFGFNHRLHPAVLKAKEVIREKILGDILGMRGVYGRSGGNQFLNSWRNNKEKVGGGILLDQGIHMLDLFRYFGGEFESVKAFMSDLFWKTKVEDNACVLLQNKRGMIASLHSSSTLWKHTFRLDIILQEGYVIIEGLLSKTGSYGREKLVIGKREFEDQAAAIGNPKEEIIYFDQDHSWSKEIEIFVECIDQQKPISTGTSWDALKVMEIVDQAYQDAQRK